MSLANQQALVTETIDYKEDTLANLAADIIDSFVNLFPGFSQCFGASAACFICPLYFDTCQATCTINVVRICLRLLALSVRQTLLVWTPL